MKSEAQACIRALHASGAGAHLEKREDRFAACNGFLLQKAVEILLEATLPLRMHARRHATALTTLNKLITLPML
jgi:hypothetical protein